MPTTETGWSAPVGVVVDREEQLRRGRTSFADHAWADAYDVLSQADDDAPLDAADLERLATAAYLVGDEDAFVHHLDRAHRGHLDDGEVRRAARCAIWAGIGSALRGEAGPASGWFAHARRLVDQASGDGPERGYLLLPSILEHAAAQRWGEVATAADDAARVAERFDDADLFALAVHEQGHALVRQGRPDEGARLLDEAMLAVTGGRLSPIATGIVYCSVIAYCQELHDLRRAREWTDALTRWCDSQPQLVAYTGQCLVHRAELLQAGGQWRDALGAAHDAQQRLLEARRPVLAGSARYRQGELHRLRGERRAAEEAYLDASRLGWPPEPGLALLRLAEGRVEVARASIERALLETTEPLDRAALLPAAVDVALATGDVAAARHATDELAAIAAQQDRPLLHAYAAGGAGRHRGVAGGGGLGQRGRAGHRARPVRLARRRSGLDGTRRPVPRRLPRGRLATPRSGGCDAREV